MFHKLFAPLIFAALLVPVAAFAQNVGGSAQVIVGPLTNCNATAITAAKDCEIRNPLAGFYGIWGYNVATFHIFYDFGTSGTGFTFTLQGCHEGLGAADCADATDWYTIQGDNFVVGTGVLTVKGATVTYAGTADDYIAWTIGVNDLRLRLHNVTAVSGAADKITVTAIMTKTGAF